MRARGPRTTRGPPLQRVALIVSLSHGGHTGSKSHRALHRRPGRRCRGPELAPPQARQSRGARGPAPRASPRPGASNRLARGGAGDRWSAAEPSPSAPRSRPTMGNRAGRSDFEWVYTDQPHTQRRKEMLGERRRCPAGVGAPRPRLRPGLGIQDPGTRAPGSASHLPRPWAGVPRANPGSGARRRRGGAGCGCGERAAPRAGRSPAPARPPGAPGRPVGGASAPSPSRG